MPWLAQIAFLVERRVGVSEVFGAVGSADLDVGVGGESFFALAHEWRDSRASVGGLSNTCSWPTIGAVPIVTLTSDFGTSDGYVGAMKGVIVSRCPSAVIVDIAHNVLSFDVFAGAYCLCQASPQFPPGTIHVAVVDPGVGTERRAVIVDTGTQLFVGPDNGLFSWVAPAPVAVYSIEAPEFMNPSVSATFHGRDVFAAAAGRLASGIHAREAGPVVSLNPLPVEHPLAVIRDAAGQVTRVRACVVHIDRFGNLISNCPAQVIPANAQVALGGVDGLARLTIERISRTFGAVAPGQLVAYVGSAGTLEVAVREGSAARTLGLEKGALLTVAPGA